MATLIIYPQAGAGGGNTTVDGEVASKNGNHPSFSNLRDSPGNSHSDATNFANIGQKTGGTFSSPSWRDMYRWIGTFDTSSPLGDTVYVATLSVYGSGKYHQLSGGTGDRALHACEARPDNNADLENSDFGKVQRTSFGSVSYENFSNGSYNDIPLNAAGISNINLTGISRFSLQHGWDLGNTFPGSLWYNSRVYYRIHNADYNGTTRDPKLVLEFSRPPIIKQISSSVVVSASLKKQTQKLFFDSVSLAVVSVGSALVILRQLTASVTLGETFGRTIGKFFRETVFMRFFSIPPFRKAIELRASIRVEGGLRRFLNGQIQDGWRRISKWWL